MTNHTSPLVDAAWLAAHRNDPHLLLLDATTGTPERTLEGARRFDLDADFSDHTSGLAHTLPSPEAFTGACRAQGVTAHSDIIVFESNPYFSGARARWMLRQAGHPRVRILDGGLPAWERAGQPTVPAPGTWPTGDGAAAGEPFTAQPFAGVATADDVRAALSSGTAAVVDVRSAGRFAGRDPEPRPGLRCGHMPGALNLPFTDLLSDGHLRPEAELAEIFARVVGAPRPTIFSCGSGVTACIGALAAERLGWPAVRVYDGSWAEWGRESLPDAEWPVIV
ncbi:sulfurtransferase [Micrococcales bacterium 31B]|nr:sulfurtransferase [Micrococcales bacterium 31B]